MLRKADLTSISYLEGTSDNYPFTTSSSFTPAYSRRVVAEERRLSSNTQSDSYPAVPLNEFKLDTTGSELPDLFHLFTLLLDCQRIAVTDSRITHRETKLPIKTYTTASSTDEHLSPEDREAREKGLQLVARIEHLYQTDEEFRHWYQEGIDEIESGHFVTFSENGWEE